VPHIPPPGFWRRVRNACDRHGTLLIFDEIPTGLGKTGKMFASQHDGVVPDIMVLGKALGGGILPIAAVIARPELDVGAAYAFGHYTHEKNPVTARAALTTIEIIEDEGLVENAARVGALALERLHQLEARNPAIGDVRGRGLLIGIELRSPRARTQSAGNACRRNRGNDVRAGAGTFVQDHIQTKKRPDAHAAADHLAETEMSSRRWRSAAACLCCGSRPAFTTAKRWRSTGAPDSPSADRSAITRRTH
jgi:4-aminobutyrate aminotransferase-like enzyme